MRTWFWTALLVLLAAAPMGAAPLAQGSNYDGTPHEVSDDEFIAVGLPALAGNQRTRCRSHAIRTYSLILSSRNPNVPPKALEQFRVTIDESRSYLDRCIKESDQEDAKQLAAQQQREQAEVARRQQEERAAEVERAQQKAIADHTKLVDDRRHDKTWMVPALSAVLCSLKLERTNVQGLIAKEKKYGKIGGVVDRVKLYNYEQRIWQADEAEGVYRKALVTWKAKPLACTDKKIKPLAPCMPVYSIIDGERGKVDVPEECAAPEIEAYAELLELDD